MPKKNNFEEERVKNIKRFKSQMEEMFEKFEKSTLAEDFVDDVIDLETLTIVEDNGVLRNMKKRPCLIFSLPKSFNDKLLSQCNKGEKSSKKLTDKFVPKQSEKKNVEEIALEVSKKLNKVLQMPLCLVKIPSSDFEKMTNSEKVNEKISVGDYINMNFCLKPKNIEGYKIDDLSNSELKKIEEQSDNFEKMTNSEKVNEKISVGDNINMNFCLKPKNIEGYKIDDLSNSKLKKIDEQSDNFSKLKLNSSNVPLNELRVRIHRLLPEKISSNELSKPFAFKANKVSDGFNKNTIKLKRLQNTKLKNTRKCEFGSQEIDFVGRGDSPNIYIHKNCYKITAASEDSSRNRQSVKDTFYYGSSAKNSPIKYEKCVKFKDSNIDCPSPSNLFKGHVSDNSYNKTVINKIDELFTFGPKKTRSVPINEENHKFLGKSVIRAGSILECDSSYENCIKQSTPKKARIMVDTSVTTMSNDSVISPKKARIMIDTSVTTISNDSLRSPIQKLRNYPEIKKTPKNNRPMMSSNISKGGPIDDLSFEKTPKNNRPMICKVVSNDSLISPKKARIVVDTSGTTISIDSMRSPIQKLRNYSEIKKTPKNNHPMISSNVLKGVPIDDLSFEKTPKNNRSMISSNLSNDVPIDDLNFVNSSS